MEPATLAAGAVVALLLLGLLVVLLRSRAETRRQLAAAQDETAALRARLDDLASRMERPAPVAAPAVSDAAYVITDAGTTADEPAVADRVVLTTTLGEPLVKALALGHGVRRALSAESRHKIRFEMRREARRTRKGRRREMKDAWRRERAREASRSTAGGTADGTAAPSADAA